MANQFEKAGIEIFPMPAHLRMRVCGTITLFTNYGNQPAIIPECFQGQPIIGSRIVAPADWLFFKVNPSSIKTSVARVSSLDGPLAAHPP